MNNIERKITKPKLGLLELAKQLGNVSAACKRRGQVKNRRDKIELNKMITRSKVIKKII